MNAPTLVILMQFHYLEIFEANTSFMFSQSRYILGGAGCHLCSVSDRITVIGTHGNPGVKPSHFLCYPEVPVSLYFSLHLRGKNDQNT